MTNEERARELYAAEVTEATDCACYTDRIAAIAAALDAAERRGKEEMREEAAKVCEAEAVGVRQKTQADGMWASGAYLALASRIRSLSVVLERKG